MAGRFVFAEMNPLIQSHSQNLHELKGERVPIPGELNIFTPSPQNSAEFRTLREVAMLSPNGPKGFLKPFGGFHKKGVSPNHHPFLDWDFPLETIQLLGTHISLCRIFH